MNVDMDRKQLRKRGRRRASGRRKIIDGREINRKISYYNIESRLRRR